jgi:hypothetical protein
MGEELATISSRFLAINRVAVEKLFPAEFAEIKLRQDAL